MSLKRQLFITSLLMLLIPWAGLQFVLELDTALRQQARDQLRDQAERLAATAGDSLVGQEPVASNVPAIYVMSVSQAIRPDGYGGNWPNYEDSETTSDWQSVNSPLQQTLKWKAVSDGRYLYLLIRVSGLQPTLFNPANPESPHDFLELFQQAPSDQLGGPTAPKSWLITPSGQGRVYPVHSEKPSVRDYRITAFWQNPGNNWQLELQLPLPESGSHLGFTVNWPQDGEQISLGTSLTPLPALAGRDQSLEQKLTHQLNQGQRSWILEPGGWVTATLRAPSSERQPQFDELSTGQVLEQISLNALRALVQYYQPEPETVYFEQMRFPKDSWPPEGLVRHQDGSLWMLTSEPVFGGRTLLLEQSLDQLLTLSGSTLGSVIARSTLIIVAITLVLLGYASWLSWRITRLQKAVNASVDPDGRIIGSLAPGHAKDELGQLQRHFSQMIDRLQGYNRYLESFSRRLSHELKTPVAVVRSSLDNLDHSESETERSQYLERAASATDRLSQILNGMSEAARLEQSFDHADNETFDLAHVASQATGAYQSLDSEHVIRYQGLSDGALMYGSPELLVQMLDKLVDNARDFTPPGGLIQVKLERVGADLGLSVFNQGSALPDNTGTDIFDPFVSLREGQGEGHLGQGLLIVRLITDYHGARVSAANEVEGAIDGVRFRVIIPSANT
ncbi:histidine kinase [Marinobacter salinexigens]|uniref:histidine kinase n=1 Tax=Marinobacter salinexigens TaxID=2919747 RepID=A0A5B0VAR3_9GAMM|nr:ATP-binding protein [Marinobacter salinexigens]KAA1171468.1 histidine kinase [Marinobacter salinexigens]